MNAIVDHSAFASAKPANTAVSLFDFKGHQIRVVMIDGDPWFVARDVGNVLYLLNTTAMLRNITSSEVRDHRLTPHGRPNKLISESALYKVVLRSDQPDAAPFQAWVTREVLPAIRKHGGYVLGQENATPDQFFRAARALAERDCPSIKEIAPGLRAARRLRSRPSSNLFPTVSISTAGHSRLSTTATPLSPHPSSAPEGAISSPDQKRKMNDLTHHHHQPPQEQPPWPIYGRPACAHSVHR